MKHRFSLTLVLEIFTMLFLFPSSISYSQEKALAKLIEDSNVIITGSVKNIKYEWEKGNIWTYVSIESSQILKGDNKLNKITIRSLGGKIGEISQIISGAPKFEIGEVSLVFLKKDKYSKGIYYCINGELGKYKYKGGSWIQKNLKQPEGFINKIKSVIGTK